jgi:hypothetical protein
MPGGYSFPKEGRMKRLAFPLAALLVIVGAGPIEGPVDVANPSEVSAPSLEELVRGPTATAGGFCSRCHPCQMWGWYADPGNEDNGWSTQSCQGSSPMCWVTCILEEEEEEDGEVLDEAEMAFVSDVVLSGDVQGTVDALQRFPNAVRLNVERRSIQFDNCAGLAANLPLTPEQFEVLTQ